MYFKKQRKNEFCSLAWAWACACACACACTCWAVLCDLGEEEQGIQMDSLMSLTQLEKNRPPPNSNGEKQSIENPRHPTYTNYILSLKRM